MMIERYSDAKLPSSLLICKCVAGSYKIKKDKVPNRSKNLPFVVCVYADLVLGKYDTNIELIKEHEHFEKGF